MGLVEELLDAFFDENVDNDKKQYFGSLSGRIARDVFNYKAVPGKDDTPAGWAHEHMRSDIGTGVAFLMEKKKSGKECTVHAAIFDENEDIIDHRSWAGLGVDECNKNLFHGQEFVILEFPRDEKFHQKNSNKSKKSFDYQDDDNDFDEDDFDEDDDNFDGYDEEMDELEDEDDYDDEDEFDDDYDDDFDNDDFDSDDDEY